MKAQVEPAFLASKEYDVQKPDFLVQMRASLMLLVGCMHTQSHGTACFPSSVKPAFPTTYFG
ncbi:hypothetical protein, partial [Microcoleus sp. OTE_8_concoct_300]|uniref:hypothetical protein n=1 Tax=Microcoleus sp. OTE_8_concoct_300 TaxID=2964710 RepID=UPI00403F26C1